MSVAADTAGVLPYSGALLDLRVQESQNGQTTATVKVRWCLTPELIRQIKARGFKKPQLVLVTRSVTESDEGDWTIRSYQDTTVKVVPLKRMMDFVSFKRPGTNQIVAAVVDQNTPEALIAIRGLVTSPGGHNYFPGGRHDGITYDTNRTILSYDGSDYSTKPFKDLLVIPLRVVQEVEVPAKMFASPPPKILRSLVKAYYRTSEIDECHFRRRATVSVLVSIVWIPIAYVLKFITLLIALIWAKRSIPFRSVIDPLEINPLVPWKEAGKSWWFWEKQGPVWMGAAKTRSLPRQVLSLPVYLIGACVMYLLGMLLSFSDYLSRVAPWIRMSPLDALGYMLLVFVVLLVVSALSVGVVAGLGYASSLLGKKSPIQPSAQRKQARMIQRERTQQRIEAEQRARLLRDLAAMTCARTPNQGVVSVDALPTSKRTVYLRFLDLKQKVCRPYAQ